MWFFLAKGNSQAKIWKSLQNSFFFKNENDLQWIQFLRRLLPWNRRRSSAWFFINQRSTKGSVCRSKKRQKPPSTSPKKSSRLTQSSMRKDGEIVSWWSKYSYCRMIIRISVSPYVKLLCAFATLLENGWEILEIKTRRRLRQEVFETTVNLFTVGLLQKCMKVLLYCRRRPLSSDTTVF